MGVKDLLKKVLPQFVTPKVTVQTITSKGNTRGLVDNSSFEHAACYTCPVELHEGNRDEVTRRCIAYYRSKIDMLGRKGVKKLHFVFDGAMLPSKSGTNAQRHKDRAAARTEADIFKMQMPARPTRPQNENYRKLCVAAIERPAWLESALRSFLDGFDGSVAVSWEIALYEADAQIAHLMQLGHYDFVVAEDQDLAVYGANKIMFKLGYSKWKYSADQCDWLDLSTWNGPIGEYKRPSCTNNNKCPTCGCAVGMSRTDMLH